MRAAEPPSAATFSVIAAPISAGPEQNQRQQHVPRACFVRPRLAPGERRPRRDRQNDTLSNGARNGGAITNDALHRIMTKIKGDRLTAAILPPLMAFTNRSWSCWSDGHRPGEIGPSALRFATVSGDLGGSPMRARTRVRIAPQKGPHPTSSRERQADVQVCRLGQSAIAGQGLASAPQTAAQLAIGRKLGAEIAKDLVAELQTMGLPAVRAVGQPGPRVGDGLVVGYFASVDAGSATERVVLGFGAGGAELKTVVKGFLMTAQGLRALGSGEVEAGSGKMPGGAVPLVVAVATANPIGLVVSGAAKAYGEVSVRLGDDRRRSPTLGSGDRG
jgi:hypothetical protein